MLLLFAWIAGTTSFLFAQTSESALQYSEQGQKALASKYADGVATFTVDVDGRGAISC